MRLISLISLIAEPPLNNPHQSNPALHYRLYLDHGQPSVVCLRDFDYHQRNPAGFLTVDAYDTKESANAALDSLVREIVKTATPAEVATAVRLVEAGAPVTRRQAVLWGSPLFDGGITLRPRPATMLDLLGGYIGHVARINRATNAYTLTNKARIDRYIAHAHLTAQEGAALTAAVQSLAAESPN